MSTRGRLLKTEDLREFAGCVRRWELVSVEIAGSSAQPEKRMRTVKWVQTGARAWIRLRCWSSPRAPAARPRPPPPAARRRALAVLLGADQIVPTPLPRAADERTTSAIVPRHPEIVAAPTPGGKPQPPLFVRASMKMKVKLKVPVPPAAGGAGAGAAAAPSPPPPQV